MAQFLPKMYLGASKPRGRNSNLSQQRLLMSEGEVEQRYLCLREKFSNGYLCLRETILSFNILPYVGTVNIKQIYLINHVSDNNTERMIPSMINSPPAEVINP